MLVQLGRLVRPVGAGKLQFFKRLPPRPWWECRLVLFAIPVLRELSLEIVRDQPLELRADVVPHPAQRPFGPLRSLRRPNAGGIESAAERDRALALSRDHELLMMHALK